MSVPVVVRLIRSSGYTYSFLGANRRRRLVKTRSLRSYQCLGTDGPLKALHVGRCVTIKYSCKVKVLNYVLIDNSIFHSKGGRVQLLLKKYNAKYMNRVLGKEKGLDQWRKRGVAEGGRSDGTYISKGFGMKV